MQIFKDDIVYIYEYKNRNKIKCFSDLIPVKVIDVVDNKENIIVSGINLDENYNELQSENNILLKTSGIVVFKKEKNFLLKDNKKFFIYYRREKKRFLLDIKEYQKTNLYSIYICLKLDENVIIKMRLNSISFDDISDIENFIELVSISRIELHDEYIQLFLNDKKMIYQNFEVYYKEQYIENDKKRRLFNYACKNKKPINDAKYDFNKIFSLKNIGYEICKM